jgi:hypothetical protein
MARAYDASHRPGAWLIPVAQVAVILLAGCSSSAGGDLASAPASGTSATPSPSQAAPPSDTSTATPPVSAAPATTPPSSSFADVDGTWCLADDATNCFTIALPRIEFVAAPGFDQYVYPAGTPTDDPASWTYADLVPHADGCYATSTDVYPPQSGAAFIYCPAGAVPADLIDRVGDASVDRVFITQEIESTPFYRTAD